MVRFSTRHWFAFACVLFLFVGSSTARSQQTTGEIDGTVRDLTGAVIVGATVTVTNTDTKEVVRTLKTKRSGEYTASLLQVGTYTVSAQAPGFEQTELTNITLATGDTLSKDIHMVPGASEQISVSIDTQKPNIETNENSSLIDSTEMKELALNTRNFEQMLLLQPGVSYGGPDELNTGQVDPTGAKNSNELSINGLQPTQVQFLLDGADMLNHTSNSQVSIFPSIDAIQQIQTVRNNYGAQYGGGGSAQVSVVTRAGSANFHGDAYFFWRSKYLNATPVFDLISSPPLPKPDIRYNDYGYTLGGPFFIPKLYPRSRSKTFFFFSQEFRRLGNVVLNTSSDFPTLAQTYGYFTTPVCLQFTTNAKTGAQTCVTGQRAPAVTNSPYPGYNYKIPSINPVAAEYMQDMFRPSIAISPPPFNPAQPNILQFQQPSTSSETQELVRIDHQFSERLSGFFRYIYDPITQHIPNSIYAGTGFPGVSPTTVATYGADFLANATWTARPTTLLAFGFSYLPYQLRATPTGTALAANSLDIHVNLPFGNTTGRVPDVVMFGGNWGAAGPTTDLSHTTQAFENTTQTVGRQVLYFGANFEHLTDSANQGTLNSGEFTYVSVQNKDTVTGLTVPVFDQTFAQVLLGQPATFTQSSVDAHTQPHENLYELYFQDNWRATSTLTLNGGVRYSIFQAPGDFSPDTSVNHAFPDGKLGDFQPEAYNSALAPTIGYDGSLCTTNAVAACSGLTVNAGYSTLNGIVGGGASTSPYGRAISRTPLLDFAPRAGFAWNVYGDGKTALRGGFGIYFEQQPLSTFQNAIYANPAYVQNPVYANPASMMNPSVVSSSSGTPVQYIGGIERQWKQPYVESWSLDVQQEMGKSDMVDVSYVGNNTVHLQGEEDLNQPPVDLYLSTNVTQGAYPEAKTDSACIPGNTVPTCSTETELNRIRPYLGWGPISYVSTRYFADYNGLQVSLLHQAGKRATFGIHYTFSKALANSVGPPTGGSGVPQFDPQNRFNLKPEWGSTLLDRREMFVAHGIYELPSHSAWHGFTGGLLNGWEVSAIVQISSGTWFTPFQITYDPAGQGGLATGSNAQVRPDQIGNPNHGPKTHTEWFNTSAYNVEPVQGSPGGSARAGTLLGPGYQSYTLDTFKNFELAGNMRLQIRVETFNLPNHVNWKNMTFNAASVSFGQVTSAYDNRTIQLGAKLMF